MPAPRESRADAFLTLRTLRDVSRLTLAAIEREDWDEVERFASESEALIAEAGGAEVGGGAVTGDAVRVLDDVRVMNGRILSRLAEKREETARRLSEAGEARTRVRALRASYDADGDLLDRDA